jgi:predicted nucleic acid-binding Zn ribbon protein
MTMKKGKPEEFQSVGQAIRKLFNSYNLSSKFDEANLLSSWETIVGKPIARRTKKLYIRNKVLFVEFDSPSMRHDFEFHKARILDMLEKQFGKGVVTGIVGM